MIVDYVCKHDILGTTTQGGGMLDGKDRQSVSDVVMEQKAGMQPIVYAHWI